MCLIYGIFNNDQKKKRSPVLFMVKSHVDLTYKYNFLVYSFVNFKVILKFLYSKLVFRLFI